MNVRITNCVKPSFDGETLVIPTGWLDTIWIVDRRGLKMARIQFNDDIEILDKAYGLYIIHGKRDLKDGIHDYIFEIRLEGY